MTENDLRKLSRTDLLEMLIAQSKENETLRHRIEELEKQLESRTITIANAGSIAEAALKLNHVFEAAQAAAEQFLDSVRAGEQQSVSREEEAREKSARILEEAQLQAKQMTQKAQEETEAYWTALSCRIERLCSGHEELQELLQTE